MKKPSKVVFIEDELEKAFYSLSDDDFLKKSLIRAINDLKQNAFSGIQIPKRLIPKKYKKNYNLSNMWNYDLPRGWRLLYTVTAENEVELISAILDWFDHKNYEKIMKY